ncbi:MAG: hypothetical protein JXR19_00790 [Bacteroidia bacterium]
MIPKEELSLIGFIKRPHGIKGNIQLGLEEEIALNKGDFLFLELEGQYIPYPILDISESSGQAIVRLGFLQEVDSIKELSGTSVYFKNSSENTQPLAVVTYRLIDDKLGDLGQVKDILQYPHQQMILIDYMGKECLVPMTEGIVHSISDENKEIYCTLPEGLLEL